MTVSSPVETSPARLRIQVRQQSAGTARISVAGEIDLATTDELQDALLHALVPADIRLLGATGLACDEAARMADRSGSRSAVRHWLCRSGHPSRSAG
jgi:hypothetical protein